MTTNPDARAVDTQVPYDDIRRALEKATSILATDLMEYEHGGGRLAIIRDGKRDLIADFYGDGHDRDLFMALRLNAEALLADAQRWRMIAEPSEETVEAVARAIFGADGQSADRDTYWRSLKPEARAALRTLEGLVK